MICKNCGHEAGSAKFCPECGTRMAVALACPNCGERVEGAKFCPECGTRLQGVAPTKKKASLLSDDEDLFAGLNAMAERAERAKAADEEYKKLLDRAEVMLLKNDFSGSEKLYRDLIEKNPRDMNAYMGLVRVATHNYTAFDFSWIDPAIRDAERVGGTTALERFDPRYKKYVADREAYFLQKKKEEEERRRKHEEAMKEAARQAAIFREQERKKKEEEDRRRQISMIYEQGKSAMRSYDYASAISAFKRVVESGNRYALSDLGSAYVGAKQYDEGIRCLLEYESFNPCQAGRGCARNGVSLGQAYELKGDYARAIQWYEKSANLGEVMAMITLVFMYQTGKGVPRSYDKAKGWILKMKEADGSGIDRMLKNLDEAFGRK